MNDLRELRETLHEHADLHDSASSTRAAAVHARVRGVRRRRRAAVSGVAVAAVAAVAVGLNLTDSGDRADPAGGLVAPQTIVSTGYTYELWTTRTDQHEVSVSIQKSDGPILVAWGTEAGADDPVKVDTPDEGPTMSAEPAFEDFYLVRPGENAKISVAGAEDDVSVAIYTLSHTAPAGVSKDGITFRQDVGVWDLVSAEIGDRGAHEMTFDLRVPDRGPVRMASLCRGLPKGYWLNLAVDDRGLEFSNHASCDDDGFDPAAGSYNVFPSGSLGKPGTTVPVRMWVSRSMEGEEPVSAAELADVRLGVSFYGVDPAYGNTSMNAPERIVESGGHTWRQSQSFESTGRDDVVQKIDGEGTHLVMATYRSPTGNTLTFAADGREIETREVGKGAGGFGEFLVPADAKSLRVAFGREGSEGTKLAVALYERAD